MVSLLNLLQAQYERGISDYWLPPLVKAKVEDKGLHGRVQDGDCMIFACRRGEREIQLMEAFVLPHFAFFERRYLPNLRFFPMVEYHPKFADYPPLFASTRLESTLGEVLASYRLKQLRIAESEKFLHVTYFFNGRRHEHFPGEERLVIPSIQQDQHLHPEMRSLELAEALINRLRQHRYSFVLLNFAAGDIFGHIPDFSAQIKCVEFIDKAVGRIADYAAVNNYYLILTADHGLLEQAYLPNGSVNVQHTTALVPFLVVEPAGKKPVALREWGSLADVAPSVIHLLGLAKPTVMTGYSLIVSEQTRAEGVIMIILDGWGVGPKDMQVNPIYAANTPHLERLFAQFPQTKLHASGEHVGLRAGSSGNSECGHLTLGAGRVIVQDEVRIPQELTAEKMQKNLAFYQAIRSLEPEQAVHLLFLLSPQSSHGSIDEALALVKILKQWDVNRIYLHCITDGRSAPMYGAIKLLPQLQNELESIGAGEIVTVCGRGYVLDRSGQYVEKTKVAYEALVDGQGIIWDLFSE